MLRRTKETRIEGKPLIVLPERVINVVTVPFESECVSGSPYTTVSAEVADGA